MVQLGEAEREGRPAAPEPAGAAGVPPWLRSAAAYTWRILVVAAGVALLGLLLSRLALVVVPLVVAVLVSTLLSPPARWLERHGVPRWLATLVVVVLAVTFIGVSTAVLLTSVVRELADLQGLLRDGGQPVLDRLGMALRVSPELAEQARTTLQGLTEGAEPPDVDALLSTVAVAGRVLTGLVLAMVFTTILVADGPGIAGWLRDRLPPGRRDLAGALGRRAWAALSGYVRGLAVVALLDAVGIGIGLVMIGVHLPAALTAIVFLSCFIPLVGPIVAGALAVLVAFVGGGPVPALLTLGLVLVVQQIAANVLQPLIIGRSVNLHPLVVVVVLTIGSILAGVVGLFVAVPLAGVVAAVGNELRLRSQAP